MHQLGISQQGHGDMLRIFGQEGIPHPLASRQVVQRFVAQDGGQGALRHEFPGDRKCWENMLGQYGKYIGKCWETLGKIWKI